MSVTPDSLSHFNSAASPCAHLVNFWQEQKQSLLLWLQNPDKVYCCSYLVSTLPQKTPDPKLEASSVGALSLDIKPRNDSTAKFIDLRNNEMLHVES